MKNNKYWVDTAYRFIFFLGQSLWKYALFLIIVLIPPHAGTNHLIIKVLGFVFIMLAEAAWKTSNSQK